MKHFRHHATNNYLLEKVTERMYDANPGTQTNEVLANAIHMGMCPWGNRSEVIAPRNAVQRARSGPGPSNGARPQTSPCRMPWDSSIYKEVFGGEGHLSPLQLRWPHGCAPKTLF